MNVVNTMVSNSKNANKLVKQNSPALLTGLGVVGLLASVFMTAKVTPKAHDILEANKKEREEKEDITKTQALIEDVKDVAPLYLPVALSVGMSVTCIVGAYKINAKRIATMAAAYSLTEAKLSEYQAKVIEKIGEKKEKLIRDEIVQDKIDQDPYAKNEVIVDGDELFYDVNGGRYFRSTEAKLNKIESRLNRRLMYEDWLTLNDFYYEIGLGNTRMGDSFGWAEGDEIDLSYGSHITGETVCKSVEFNVRPII